MDAQATGENVLTALSNAMAEAVARAGTATVLVNARRRLPASGIGYAPGLVLTADHVIERDDDITVVLPDGTEVAATLAGRDPGSDLALLRVNGGNLTVAETASQEARVGQLVLALGRPTNEGIQASVGIVSAIGGPVRTGRGSLIERYLRTDTTPYPGFSGGPLVDTDGRVVGLNTSGLARGAALTIPAGLAWQIAGTLSSHGRVRRGYLGIRSQPVGISQSQQQALGREQPTGLLLVWVEESSPAAQGGLIVGDILVAVGGHPVADPDELQSVLSGSVVGQPTPVQILRGGEPTTVTVTIGERK
ncbi:MAG TPA: signal protein PDZ [Chloroflexi bacterium]|nr:signal protein PDZ [Chloroflexota bacterium]